MYLGCRKPSTLQSIVLPLLSPCFKTSCESRMRDELHLLLVEMSWDGLVVSSSTQAVVLPCWCLRKNHAALTAFPIHTSCCSKHPHHRVFRWYLLLIIVCLTTFMCVCISERGGERGRMEGGRDEERELCDVSVPPSGLIFSFHWVPRVALTSSGYIASIFTHWAAHSAITRMLAQSCTVQPPLLWIYSYIDCAFCLLTFC